MAAYGTIKEFLQATIALIAISNSSRIEPSLRRNEPYPVDPSKRVLLMATVGS
jgi:hypothetical protein